MKNSFFSCVLLASIAKALSSNYLQNGKDWPGLCQTGKSQSPIDLTTGQRDDLVDITWIAENISNPQVGSAIEQYADYEQHD